MQSSVSTAVAHRGAAVVAGKLRAMRHPSPARVLAVLTAALLTVAAPAHAQWKWKDSAGRVQYSDLPPPQGTPEASILSRPSTRTTVAPRQATAPLPAASLASGAGQLASAPRGVDPELEARRRKAEDEVKAKNKAEEDRVAAARAENCRRAQAGQRTIDSGMRVMRTNEKGEREYLDDAQRAQERQRLQQTISTDCR